MITIPLYTVLIAYFAFMAIILLFIHINVMHVFHSGSLTFVSFAFTFFVTVFIIVNFFYTLSLLYSADWQQPLTLWNGNWISSTLNLTNI